MPINSDFRFALPQLPPGVDPQLALLLQPLYTAVFSLFVQTSNAVGATTVLPADYSSVAIYESFKLNTFRKAYLKNNTASTIVAGRLVGIISDGSIKLCSVSGFPATRINAVGFTSEDIVAGAYGTVIIGEGILRTTGLTAGTRYSAVSGGTFTPSTTAPFVALALSTEVLYIKLPLEDVI